MKAARLHEYGRPLSLDEIERPRPAPGEVIVKIAGAGFCHSDIHVIDGELRVLPKLPVTLGHENGGHVAAVGAGVTSLLEGDPVLVYGGWGCGRCDRCLIGEEQLCATPRWVGLSAWDGGYAEYLRVPEARYLVPVHGLSPRDAAPLADAALTPYRAVKRALRYISPERPTLVVGAGGLGQYGIAILRTLTGSPIIVVDSDEKKLVLARELGATAVFRGDDPHLTERMAAAAPKGVCAAFDFVGADATLALALRATVPGGKVTQIGLAGGTARMKPLVTNGFEVLFETTLWGTVKELHEVVALVESGRLALRPVELAPLARINDVYARLKRGQVQGRVVITP